MRYFSEKSIDMTNAYSTEELLGLFIFSMEPYHRAADVLPFSEGLLAFDGTSRTLDDALVSVESDTVALESRLMLQRKYFQNRETVHFRNVMEVLEFSGKVDAADIAALKDAIAELREIELELGTGNGELRRGAHQNIEDATYGFLLHGDMSRARRVASTSNADWVLALSNIVVKREKLLFLLERVIRNAGFLPLSETVEDERSAVVRFSKTMDGDLGIRKSPRWSNLAGKDLSDAEIDSFAAENNADDNTAILMAAQFLNALAAVPLNVKELRKRTVPRTWLQWGDYSEAAAKYAAFRSPGFSSRVLHNGGPKFAQVKIFEGVEAPFSTNTPQLIEGVSFVTLEKLRGEWKVLGFIDGRR